MPAWGLALSATLVLGVPLTVLPILDGLLFVAPPLLVARDLALLAALLALPCLWLALLAWGVQRLMRNSLLAWSILLLPLALLVLRQGGRVALQWLSAVLPGGLMLSGELKLLLLAAVAALGAAGMLRWGWARSLAGLRGLLLGLRGPALLLGAGAVLALALAPPRWQAMPSKPAAAGPAVSGPNLLLIAIDTVAMQDADACNPASSTMPELARFAQSASCFQRYQTVANFTTAATSTLETGLLPWRHHATQPDATLHPAVRQHLLAAQLQAAGWRTHSVTDNLLASPRHHGSSAAYDSAWLTPTGLWVNAARFAATRFPDTALPRLMAASLAFLAPIDNWRNQRRSPYRSEAVYEDLLRLLAQERSNGRPQFVFALTLPPHAPYLPPPSTRYKLLGPGQLERLDQLMPDNLAYPPEQQARVDLHRLRYRESLMAADAALGEALRRLEAEGWLANTVVVITTDHGESFEKGYLGHAGAPLHQALLHGPLVIRLPGQTQGRLIAQPVSQVDLAPTLLDLAGAAPLPQAEGRSLRPLLEGRELAPAPVFSMALERQHRDAPLRHGEVAVIDGDWKLLYRFDDGRQRLYHLGRDPGESTDLAAAQPAEVRRLQALIQAGLARAEQGRSAAQ